MTEITANERKSKVKTPGKDENMNENVRLDRVDQSLPNIASDNGGNPNVRPPKNRRMIKGIFKNLECPGTMLSFPFRKYKEPVKHYYLFDGEEYELPIEVVEHLNKDCAYKEHGWKLGKEERLLPMDGSKHDNKKEVKNARSRFAFQPLEYVSA